MKNKYILESIMIIINISLIMTYWFIIYIIGKQLPIFKYKILDYTSYLIITIILYSKILSLSKEIRSYLTKIN